METLTKNLEYITEDGRYVEQKVIYVIGCGTCEYAYANNQPPFIPHSNCLYGGKAIGHNSGHCTADACY
jgi:hypothetical protein